jgi:hypothetical protein
VSASISGILADLVRVRVVSALLVHPPAVADAHHQRCEHSAGAVVRLAGLEDLAVGGLVPEERELREDQAEPARQQQLQPGIIEQDHSSGAARQCQHQNGEDHQAEAAAATLQPSDTDGLDQLGKCVGKRLVA